MKTSLILILSFATFSSYAFQPSTVQKVTSSATALHMSSVDKKKKKNKQFDFLYDFFSHPFHAQGSSHNENELDDMYKTQQAVLSARRAGFNKDKLRRKYSHVNEDHLKDIPLHKHDPAFKNKQEDDAMYVDESGPSFEIPFLKNMNKLKP